MNRVTHKSFYLPELARVYNYTLYALHNNGTGIFFYQSTKKRNIKVL